MQLNRSIDYAIQMFIYLVIAGKTELTAVISATNRYLLQISTKLRSVCIDENRKLVLSCVGQINTLKSRYRK